MQEQILFTEPKKEDAKHIVDLIKRGGTLDLNSEYLYLLQSTHFSQTCCVAKYEDEVIGFVSGYINPKKSNELFIWQVAVDNRFRGKNLAQRIILSIFEREALKEVNHICATVSPSNISSQRVFEKIATGFDAELKKETLFSVEDFLDSHEEEVQFLIGPIKK
jgi:L-2,4-diaminobutyric acid acetyltransferase